MPSKRLIPLLGLAFLLVCCTGSVKTQTWTPKMIVGMDYPKPANWAAIQGQVKIICSINQDGSVSSIRPEGNPHPILFKAVQENASQWVFMKSSGAADLQNTAALTYSFSLTEPCSNNPHSQFRFEYPNMVSITAPYACLQTSGNKKAK